MDGKRRIILLVIIMAGVAVGVGGMMLYALYKASFEQQRERLVEIAHGRAYLIEAIARFDAVYSAEDVPGGAFAATLGQIRDAHKHFEGFGETGEFTMAKREGDQIVFLLSHRHHDFEDPKPLPFSSGLAEPMQRALSGESGTVVGPDYRGVRVLAAHEPVEELNVGIVAKIDLAELRAPFVRAGLMAGGGAAVLMVVGTLLFLRVSGPIVQRLEESERKYRGIFESAVDMLFLIDSAGRILDANPAACSAHGFSREELLGKTIREIIRPEDRFLADKAAEQVAEGKTFSLESTHLRKDGTSFPVEVRLSPTLHEGQTSTLAAVRDITERKQAEEQLRFQAQLLDNVRESVVARDLDGRIIYWGKGAKALYGYSAEEILGELITFIVGSQDGEEERERMRRVLETGMWSGQDLQKRKDGSSFWADTVISLVKDHNGRPFGLIGIDRDITESKRAEEKVKWELAVTAALSKLYKPLISAFSSMEDITGTVLDQAITLTGSEHGYVNSIDTATGDAIGHTLTEMMGSQCRVSEENRTIVFPRGENGLYPALWGYSLNALEAFFTNSPETHPASTGLPEGHIPVERFLTMPVMLEEELVGQIALANKPEDYTDLDLEAIRRLADFYALAIQRKRVENALRTSESRYRGLSESLEEAVRQKVAQLRQAESMAAIGQMVSIVAHEVRNPLQNIQMGVDAIQKKIGQDKDKQEILDEINYGVNILNGIVEELLEYSKPVRLRFSSAPIGDIVGNALKTVDHRLGGVNTLVDLEHENRDIAVDVPKFSSVLVNLLSNAAEAMPAGGDLRISSQFLENDGITVLRLSISDSGCGIDEEHLDRIRQPFFTTKTKGTGLGIPACEKIIEAHNGNLTISSKLSEGTTVDIEIPAQNS